MQQPAFPKTFWDFHSFENKQQMNKIAKATKGRNLTPGQAIFLKRIKDQVYKLSQKSSQPFQFILSMYQRALAMLGWIQKSCKQTIKGYQLTYLFVPQLATYHCINPSLGSQSQTMSEVIDSSKASTDATVAMLLSGGYQSLILVGVK